MKHLYRLSLALALLSPTVAAWADEYSPFMLDRLSSFNTSPNMQYSLMDNNALKQTKTTNGLRGFGGVVSFELYGFHTTDLTMYSEGEGFTFASLRNTNVDNGWQSFTDFYSHINMWTTFELLTPFINLKYQFDIPLYNTIGEQMRFSRYSFNFFRGRDLKEVYYPDLTYTIKSTRYASEKTLDVAALAFLQFKRTECMYAGQDKYVNTRFYYFSFSRCVEILSKYIRYTNIKACMDGNPDAMVESFFWILPKPYYNIFAEWDNTYKKVGGEWVLQEDSVNWLCGEGGLFFIHDFVFPKHNMILQPSIYWSGRKNGQKFECFISLQYIF